MVAQDQAFRFCQCDSLASTVAFGVQQFLEVTLLAEVSCNYQARLTLSGLLMCPFLLRSYFHTRHHMYAQCHHQDSKVEAQRENARERHPTAKPKPYR